MEASLQCKTHEMPAWSYEILWSDDTRIRQFVLGGNRYSSSPALYHPTVKHGGGSIMLWGMVLVAKIERLIRVEGTIHGAMWSFFFDENLQTRLEDHLQTGQWDNVRVARDNSEYLWVAVRALTWTQSKISGETWTWLPANSPQTTWESLR